MAQYILALLVFLTICRIQASAGPLKNTIRIVNLQSNLRALEHRNFSGGRQTDAHLLKMSLISRSNYKANAGPGVRLRGNSFSGSDDGNSTFVDLEGKKGDIFYESAPKNSIKETRSKTRPRDHVSPKPVRSVNSVSHVGQKQKLLEESSRQETHITMPARHVQVDDLRAAPAVDDASGATTELQCSIESEMGVILHGAACSVTTSNECRQFDDARVSSATWLRSLHFSFTSPENPESLNEKSGVTHQPAELDLSNNHSVGQTQSGALTLHSVWNTNAALVLWISLTPRSENPTQNSSMCWRVLFNPTPGWPESVIRVQGFPVCEGRYTASVTSTMDQKAVLARQSVDVVSLAGQQKAMEVRLLSDEEIDLPRLDDSVRQSSYLRDRKVEFFHFWPDGDSDASTTSDPWEPPVVERPRVSKLTPFGMLSSSSSVMRPPRIASLIESQSGYAKNFQQENLISKNPIQSAKPESWLLFSGQNNNGSSIWTKPQKKLSRAKRSTICRECVRYMKLDHDYDTSTAIFLLKMSFNCTSANCCRGCSGSVIMQLYQESIDAESCEALAINMQTLSNLYPVANAGYISADSPYSLKLSTGCYLATLDLGEKAMLGFSWFQPDTEPPDLNAWNTTFFLQPKPHLSEVEVRWTQPRYPQNFSRYSLQLWYQADRPLNCSGYHTDTGDLLQVHPTPSLPLDEPVGVFQDLLPGWYCARVTPMDARCPRDGCAVRASHAVHLDAPSALLSTNAGSDVNTTMPASIAAFAAVAAILLLLLLIVFAVVMRAKLRFKNMPTSRGRHYHKVSLSPPEDRPCVLLVWTRRGDTRALHGAAVATFKRLLSSRFAVWDYLDLLSLPPLEREGILENPAGWLYTAVHNPNIKVLIVSSKGAELWQEAVQRGDSTNATLQDAASPLDAQLFSYLLQLLLHDPSLMADYSKVFVASFEDDDSDGGESLSGLVHGLRYRLPDHLMLLTRAMLGIPAMLNDETSDAVDYPTSLLQEFRASLQRLREHDTSRLTVPDSTYLKTSIIPPKSCSSKSDLNSALYSSQEASTLLPNQVPVPSNDTEILSSANCDKTLPNG
ncbi:uncharacterized protein LOC108676703 isoform X2 [Hyalella azteca]|uniref:Uncharacterized protein LOC108676703 isoform X2 n=1 Tax=Hyalella azteca TaxID=294128 RepID=A0A8B7P2X9_HYAAZ|nr:uncharacterized protein LOC108676703 isoform X2 [Hyalella azteca]